MRWPWQRTEDDVDIGRTPMSDRDERLSEYLDGMLGLRERASVEAEAQREEDVRAALEGMREVRANLGQLGLDRAPRAFIISPNLAPRQVGLPRLELYTRLGAAAAALALTVVSVLPTITGNNAGEFLTTSELRSASEESAQDVATTSNASKQAAEAPEPASSARSAAPAFAPANGGPTGAGSGGGAGGAIAPSSLPPSAPQPGVPQPVEPGGTKSFGAAENAPASNIPPQPATTSDGESMPPVELSREGSAFSIGLAVQIGFALAASVLATFALLLALRRRSESR